MSLNLKGAVSLLPRLSAAASGCPFRSLPVLLAALGCGLGGCTRTEVLLRTEPIPYETRITPDPCLRPGEAELESRGKPGLVQVEIERQVRGDRVLSARERSRAVIRQPVPAVVRRGEPRSVAFAGRTWTVKSGRKMGPGPNTWSSDNVQVEGDQLVLRLTRADPPTAESGPPAANGSAPWRCAEVQSADAMGYGEYRWILAPGLAATDPNVVRGFFVYEDDQHEIDIELSQWGNADDPLNAQFVVQPAGEDSVHHFQLRYDWLRESGVTLGYCWRPDEIVFRCWLGNGATSTAQLPLLAEWRYRGPKVPRPSANTRAHVNLWLAERRPGSPANEARIVLTGFIYAPDAAPHRGLQTWGAKPRITVWVADNGRTVHGYVEHVDPDTVGEYLVRCYALTDIWYIQPYLQSAHKIDPRTMHFETWTRPWQVLRADLWRGSRRVDRDYYREGDPHG